MKRYKTVLRFIFFVILVLSIISSCQKTKKHIDEKVNVLWLVAEDLSPYIPPFGDSTIVTPNLSRLAAEGVRYTNVYSISGVCSPSRAALATGMYPSSIGAHHMRTLYQQPAAKAMGIINYECVPPPNVKMVSQIMREQGYYCTNNAKQDYQFHPSLLAWDESSVFAHWRNRPNEKPFFSIFNFGVTHESNMWNPFYRRYDVNPFPQDRETQWWKQFQGVKKPLFVSSDLEVRVPPYLPETQPVIKDIRRMYSNIVEMDRHVGLILDQLEDDGLLEKTIIVWYTDHGGPLPREKRLLYDSGLNVPMIIRYPDRRRAGSVDKQMISFVDFAPTLLSMVGIDPPEWMQGMAYAGRFKETEDRKYIHAAGDRFDEKYDMIRAVRDKQFKYLKNFKPDLGYYLPLDYRENMATTKELLKLRDKDSLNEVQAQWFRKTKPEEELFDCLNDPHELYNLANDPVYKLKLEELRKECTRWMQAIDDKGRLPEVEMIESFWPGKVQPKTEDPEVEIHEGKMSLICDTEGASIGYKYLEQVKEGIGWEVYEEPVNIEAKGKVMVVAHRIGYLPSDTLEVSSL